MLSHLYSDILMYVIFKVLCLPTKHKNGGVGIGTERLLMHVISSIHRNPIPLHVTIAIHWNYILRYVVYVIHWNYIFLDMWYMSRIGIVV